MAVSSPVRHQRQCQYVEPVTFVPVYGVADAETGQAAAGTGKAAAGTGEAPPPNI